MSLFSLVIRQKKIVFSAAVARFLTMHWLKKKKKGQLWSCFCEKWMQQLVTYTLRKYFAKTEMLRVWITEMKQRMMIRAPVTPGGNDSLQVCLFPGRWRAPSSPAPCRDRAPGGEAGCSTAMPALLPLGVAAEGWDSLSTESRRRGDKAARPPPTLRAPSAPRERPCALPALPRAMERSPTRAPAAADAGPRCPQPRETNRLPPRIPVHTAEPPPCGAVRGRAAPLPPRTSPPAPRHASRAPPARRQAGALAIGGAGRGGRGCARAPWQAGGGGSGGSGGGRACPSAPPAGGGGGAARRGGGSPWLPPAMAGSAPRGPELCRSRRWESRRYEEGPLPGGQSGSAAAAAEGARAGGGRQHGGAESQPAGGRRQEGAGGRQGRGSALPGGAGEGKSRGVGPGGGPAGPVAAVGMETRAPRGGGPPSAPARAAAAAFAGQGCAEPRRRVAGDQRSRRGPTLSGRARPRGGCVRRRVWRLRPPPSILSRRARFRREMPPEEGRVDVVVREGVVVCQRADGMALNEGRGVVAVSAVLPACLRRSEGGCSEI